MFAVFFHHSQFKKFHKEVIVELEKKTEMDVKYMNVSLTSCCISCQCKHPEIPQMSCLWIPNSNPSALTFTCQTGHIQALSVRTQSQTGLPGALQDRPEEAAQEKPGEALLQVRVQRERGETQEQTQQTFQLERDVSRFVTLIFSTLLK